MRRLGNPAPADGIGDGATIADRGAMAVQACTHKGEKRQYILEIDSVDHPARHRRTSRGPPEAPASPPARHHEGGRLPSVTAGRAARACHRVRSKSYSARTDPDPVPATPHPPGSPAMLYRTLGGTGIEVSAHCLGTMMFGSVGNPDHADSVRVIHAALDAGINFVDTADMYSAGESETIVGKALKGAARRRRRRHQGPLPDGRGTQPGRKLAALDRQGGRGEPAPPRHRLDRPLPGPPPRSHDGHRGDPLRADRPRAGGEDPRLRLLDVPDRGDRGVARRRRAARPRAVPDRAAAVLDPRPRYRAGRPADLPAVRDGRADLVPLWPPAS